MSATGAVVETGEEGECVTVWGERFEGWRDFVGFSVSSGVEGGSVETEVCADTDEITSGVCRRGRGGTAQGFHEGEGDQ